MTTADVRRAVLRRAHYNFFAIPLRDVLIDLLTDSSASAAAGLAADGTLLRHG